MEFGVVLAVAVAVLAWFYYLGGLAWLIGVSSTECRYRTIGGRESRVELTHVTSVTVVEFGFLTHVIIKINPQRFWSIRRNHLIAPVRGPFMANQPQLNKLLELVDRSIVRQTAL